MARPPRIYSDEFREAAVARLKNESRKTVAKDLDISSSLLDGWARKINAGIGFKSIARFDDNAKLKALKRLESEKVEDIAADLKIRPELLRQWRSQFNRGLLPLGAKGKRPKKPAPQSRKVYPPAFKRAAVARIGKKGQTLTTVSAALGIGSGMLSNWRRDIQTGIASHHPTKRGPKPGKKNYYVNVADRAVVTETEDDSNGRARAVTSAVALLRGIRSKINVSDPVHLTAMLALQTLEGKM